MTEMQKLYLLVPLAPLFGAIVAGLFGKIVGRRGAHIVTILGVLRPLCVHLIFRMSGRQYLQRDPVSLGDQRRPRS
jgi:NADH:ubiquinone oxidoreductase subunit 5 (subunit L)/multisubunit Na+/H+ antiporter MnhA subunit